MNMATKKTFYTILTISIICLIGIITYAIDTSKAYHPLQQVAKSANDDTSVDSDGDGVIDNAGTAVTATNADNVKCDGEYKSIDQCGLQTTVSASLECQSVDAGAGSLTGDQICNQEKKICVGVFGSGKNSYAEECDESISYDTRVRCCQIRITQ